MIPSKRLLGLLALPISAALLAILGMVPHSVGWRVLFAVGLLAAADAIFAAKRQRLSITREMPAVLALSVASPIKITVHNSTRRMVRCQLFDDLPITFDYEGMPAKLDIPGSSSAHVMYTTIPKERGQAYFRYIEARVASPWRLWWQCYAVEQEHRVRVYPNFRALARYALLAAGNRLGALGIHQQHQRGQGSDFLELREFRDGDSPKHVDWKATSRRSKLIARSFHEERDQQIVLVLDCGRNLHAKDGALSHFDHSLNAILLLAYVALRQGDRVGLLAVRTHPIWLQPRPGVSQMQRLLAAVYDLSSEPAAIPLGYAVTTALQKLRRRSFLVLATNVRDDLDLGTQAALRAARRQHLLVTACLRERVLDELQATPIDDSSDAATVAATHLYVAERRQRMGYLQSVGIACLDTYPEALPHTLVNHYLALKACGAF